MGGSQGLQTGPKVGLASEYSRSGPLPRPRERRSMRAHDIIALIPIRRPRRLRGPAIERPVRSPVIRTERLVLRPHRLRDAGEWFAIQSDPAVVEHLPWPLRTRAESFVHLVHRTRHDRLEHKDDFLALAVEREGTLIGDVSLHLRDCAPETRYVEVGWVMSTGSQGHGYAREAAEAMLELSFEQLQARRAIARIAHANAPSFRLAERLGFSHAAEVEGLMQLELTAEEYRQRHPRDGNDTP